MGFTSLAALSSGVCFVLTSGVGSFTTHHCHFHITASSLEHLLLWVLCHPGEIFSLFDWCDYDMGSWLILSIIGHHLMHLKSLLSVKHILIPCIGTAISLVSATIISFLDFFFFCLLLNCFSYLSPVCSAKRIRPCMYMCVYVAASTFLFL